MAALRVRMAVRVLLALAVLCTSCGSSVEGSPPLQERACPPTVTANSMGGVKYGRDFSRRLPARTVGSLAD